MRALTDFDVDSLAQQLAAWGCKPSQAARILHDLYINSGRLNLKVLGLGRKLEQLLHSELLIRQSEVLQRHESADGTVKLLLGFKAGGAVETTLMHTHFADRAAGCLSSQIGCAMGCEFCASTRGGLTRNLSSGEIVEQFLQLRQEAAHAGRRLHTIVFMGMGEPLLNFNNVIEAIQRIGGAKLGAIGWRQMTVSTVGIVPAMDRLAAANLNINLAVSLHAPDDETRSRIVPANKRYGVAQVLAAAKRFYEQTGRITNIEYCLLAGVNDADAQARQLAQLLQGFRTHVNVIPYNAIGAGLSGQVYRSPGAQRVQRFVAVLREAQVVAHLRKTRGSDVNAACGQLRAAQAD